MCQAILNNQYIACKDLKKYSYSKSPTNCSQYFYLVSNVCSAITTMSYFIKITRACGQVGRVYILNNNNSSSAASKAGEMETHILVLDIRRPTVSQPPR